MHCNFTPSLLLAAGMAGSRRHFYVPSSSAVCCFRRGQHESVSTQDPIKFGVLGELLNRMCHKNIEGMNPGEGGRGVKPLKTRAAHNARGLYICYEGSGVAGSARGAEN